MQDNSTGQMIQIENASQAAKDNALPRDRQGAVFQIGEEVEIKGGRFAVHSIGKSMIVFRGLPGTDIERSQ